MLKHPIGIELRPSNLPTKAGAYIVHRPADTGSHDPDFVWIEMRDGVLQVMWRDIAVHPVSESLSDILWSDPIYIFEGPETMRQKIARLRTGNGGWTKAALAELGVPWPPPKGWRKRLLKESQD